MAEISLEAVTGKLNRVGYDAFMRGLRQAKSAGHRHLELGHWMLHILQQDSSDLALTADHYKLDRARLIADVGAVVNTFRRNETTARVGVERSYSAGNHELAPCPRGSGMPRLSAGSDGPDRLAIIVRDG